MKKSFTSWLLALQLLLVSTIAFAQDRTVTGKVTSVQGEGLPGVSVVVKGQQVGTFTDVEGAYKLNIPAEAKFLVFSFVGYKPQEVEIGSQSNIDVKLAEETRQLDEVVVTGLATSVKRSNLANNISTVSSKELTGTTTPQTLDGALYGKFTGANIVANSGAPGGGISMKLRGITTITGSSEPLYIVDGIYIDNSSISSGTNTVSQASVGGGQASNQDNPSNRIADLNPEDIESIEILKGASAAAIYGARANAGVVIITTKKGKKGKTSINFTQDFGMASALRFLGYRSFNDDIVRNQFGASELTLYQAAKSSGKIYDYEKEIYGNIGFLRNTGLNIQGGNDKTSFFISGNVRSEGGIVKNTGFDRNVLRANIDHKFSDFVDIGVTSTYTNSYASRSITNNDNNGVSLGVALSSTVPWANLFADANGNFPDNPYSASNPLHTVAASKNQENTNRILTGGTVNFNFIRRNDMSLKLTLRGGVDYYNNETYAYFPENSQIMRSTGLNGFVAKGNNVFFNTNTSAFLVFTKTAGKFDLTSSLGISRLDFDQKRTTVQALGLIGAQTNLEQAASLGVFNRTLKQTDIGYTFQQEVNYNDQIIATAGIRFDQSSMNGDPNKLYAFPKGSVAVNIHKFDFWKVEAVNQLKFRVAYGEAGGIPSANQVSLAIPAFTTFGGANISGQAGSLIGTTRGNKEIRPERSKEFETGIDFSLFDSKVGVEITYYDKTVDDLIINQNVPTSTGFTTRIINGAKIQNRGLEIGITLVPINTEKLKWSFKPNFWTNSNEVLRLDVPAFITGGFSTALGAFKIEEGKSLTQIVGRIPDKTGDQVTGNSNPAFQMSFYNDMTIMKNLQFSMLWHWKAGGDNINLTNLLYDFGGITNDYDGNKYSSTIKNGDYRIQAIGRDTRVYVEDASFVKLREIALHYTLPKQWLNVFKGTVSSLKVGVSGNNLLLFTPYSSYDPEVSNFGNNGISTGVDVTPFPSSRRVLFHIAASF